MTLLLTIILCLSLVVLFWTADYVVRLKKRFKWPMRIVITLIYCTVLFGWMIGATYIISLMEKDILQIFIGIAISLFLFIGFVLYCAIVVGAREEKARRELLQGSKNQEVLHENLS